MCAGCVCVLETHHVLAMSGGEVIRLTGVGSAAGLLASKGIGKFANTTSQAIDLDQLASAMAKKRKEEG